MSKIEVREVELVTGETSPTGDTTRTDTAWQLGAEIEGVWVPFATVNQGQYDHAKQRQEDAEAREGRTTNAGKAEGKPDAAK